jgi:DNA repair protein SbcC/Rad50
MRPLRLDLDGFTVFREPTTVDLTDADFFALVGPTGSGKSTVLDAICFALYGTVPRWSDRRRVDQALAPSAAQAKVRLVFEASGARFVATRVVRRDPKGKVQTSHAGLEQLPPGFDLSTFDTAPAERDMELGTVLAGTTAEMEAAVTAAVGLPYEQFISCVLLPQGEFARFLHAKPADRQEILVNLLGLHVYQRIGERAAQVHKDAEAAATAARSLLNDLADADDAALARADAAVTAAATLGESVTVALPGLSDAAAAGQAAQVRLAQVEGEIVALSSVRIPGTAASVAGAVNTARDAADAAEKAVHIAEEREEKLRAELAAAGDPASLRSLIAAYGRERQLAGRVRTLAAASATISTEQEKAGAAAQKARVKAEKATLAALQAAQAVEAAQTADRAASLRPHLEVGHACPVCLQTVTTLPDQPDAPVLAAARSRLADAEKAAKAAAGAVDQQERLLREVERKFASATAAHEEAAATLAQVQAELAGAPDLAALEASLGAITATETTVEAAADAVRAARRAAREANEDSRTAQTRLHQAWRAFDEVRDSVATMAPPPADRDDLVGSWQSLHAWAGAAALERQTDREAALRDAEAALAAMTDLVRILDALFAEAGQPPVRPAGDPGAYQRAVAVAIERAQAAHQRCLDKREQAARLADQVAQREREAQVAKMLALHLRADRFERWLLAEALATLVAGASRILRDLSGGQYDLAHDKGEFFVIDHADAGLRRPVRTLSGGETFQASLALALALSEQLAGLSSSPASLESIMLDEGFGTLDAASLETVAATLENLASRGDRMVGVVTHVAALAERIPVRFEVRKDAKGSATVERAA